jgi:hypothetical protein
LQIRGVGVPDAAEIDRLVLQLGDIDDLGKTFDASHEGILDRCAEPACQGQEASGRQVLIAEEDDQMVQECLADFGDRRVG